MIVQIFARKWKRNGKGGLCKVLLKLKKMAVFINKMYKEKDGD